MRRKPKQSDSRLAAYDAEFRAATNMALDYWSFMAAPEQVDERRKAMETRELARLKNCFETT